MLADIGDLRVYYTVAGTGPPVVLVHGIGADAHVWDEVVPPLAKRFRVYALDLRGFGRTVRPPLPRLSYDLWVDDVRGFVDRVAGGPASLVGWSLGGAVGLNVGLRHPQVLRTLVLIGTPSPLRPPTDRSGFNERLRLAEAGAPIEEIVDKTFEFTEAAYSPHTRATNPAAVDRMRQTLLRNDPRAYAEMVEANRARPDISARLAEIRVPTLVLVGEDDARTPVEMSEDLNRSIPDSYLKILPGCGHFYPYEQPEETSRIIVDFLERCGPR
jgi:pimeloyl-ACP methyl ester carboxylesterase